MLAVLAMQIDPVAAADAMASAFTCGLIIAWYSNLGSE